MASPIQNPSELQTKQIPGESDSVFAPIPVELLMMILSRIGSVEGMLRCSRVCKRWRDVCKTESLLKEIIQASPLQSMILKVNKFDCVSGEGYNAFFCPISREKMKDKDLAKRYHFFDENLQNESIRCFNASKHSLLFAMDIASPELQYRLMSRSFKDNRDISSPDFNHPIVQVITSNQVGYALMEMSPHSSSEKRLLHCWDFQERSPYPLSSDRYGSVNHIEMQDGRLFCAHNHQITVVRNYNPFKKDAFEEIISVKDSIDCFCINKNHLFVKMRRHKSYAINEITHIGGTSGIIVQVDMETQKTIQEYDLWWWPAHFSSYGNLLVSECAKGFDVQDIRENTKNRFILGSAKSFSKQLQVINECIFDLEDDGELKIWDLRMPVTYFQPQLDHPITQFAYVEDLLFFSSSKNLHVYSPSKITVQEKVPLSLPIRIVSFIKNMLFNY